MQPASPAEPPPPPRTPFRLLARSGRRRATPWLSVKRWRQRMLLVGAALLAGLVAILFALGAESAISIHAEILRLSPWLSLLLAPAGFATMAWLSRKYFRGTQGSGIPQAIAASHSDDPAVRGQLLSLRLAFAKVALTLGGLLAGASIGREGPSVQVGAAVLHSLAGRRFGRIASSRNLIVAGGAAGVAAAFNTPLGGIMFAIEEMCRHHAFRANSTTLTAVIFAGLMSLALLGNYTYFGRTPAMLAWPSVVWAVAMCGALGGALGGAFSRLLIASSRGLPGRIGEFARTQPITFAAVCGLGTALLGLATGGLTDGTGYAESKAALEGRAGLPLYFFAAKMLAIWLAFLSGIPGGVFAPALAAGAGVGTLVAHLLGPSPEAPMLVLGMVAFLSGMTRTPITSFVIVMEMTANHEMLLPLMATSLFAQGVSRSISPLALYDALATATLRRTTVEVLAAATPPARQQPAP